MDGLEVTFVGTIGPILTSRNGLNLTPAQGSLAATAYFEGACAGAVVFGFLTDV